MTIGSPSGIPEQTPLATNLSRRALNSVKAKEVSGLYSVEKEEKTLEDHKDNIVTTEYKIRSDEDLCDFQTLRFANGILVEQITYKAVDGGFCRSTLRYDFDKNKYTLECSTGRGTLNATLSNEASFSITEKPPQIAHQKNPGQYSQTSNEAISLPATIYKWQKDHLIFSGFELLSEDEQAILFLK